MEKKELEKMPTDATVMYHIKHSIPTVKEIEIKLKYVKQKNFELTNKLGKWLAYKLKKKRDNDIKNSRKKQGISR